MTNLSFQFDPVPGLRNGHSQTLAASLLRAARQRDAARALAAATVRRELAVAGGVRLQAWETTTAAPAATVVLIHGWLGSHDSSYQIAIAHALWQANIRVLRLNLRDHGETAHLNREMFHSARTQEVVEAVLQLVDGARQPGVMGFSLGGNFALRVARDTGLRTLAICPAIDPARTMEAIDQGWFAYRLYFVRRWQSALVRKQQAHPDRYDFSEAAPLRSVAALTDYFVRHHTEFASTRDYLNAYTLTGTILGDTRATVIHAEDDPVVPVAGFDSLPSGIHRIQTRHGGHCAYLHNWRLESALEALAVRFFLEPGYDPDQLN